MIQVLKILKKKERKNWITIRSKRSMPLDGSPSAVESKHRGERKEADSKCNDGGRRREPETRLSPLPLLVHGRDTRRFNYRHFIGG